MFIFTFLCIYVLSMAHNNQLASLQRVIPGFYRTNSSSLISLILVKQLPHYPCRFYFTIWAIIYWHQKLHNWCMKDGVNILVFIISLIWLRSLCPWSHILVLH